MRIVMLSDTHGLHREVDVPYGDLLIHAWDASYFSRRAGWAEDFDDWLSSLPHQHKILVPGNHEFSVESNNGPHKLFKQISSQCNRAPRLVGGFTAVSHLRCWLVQRQNVQWVIDNEDACS